MTKIKLLDREEIIENMLNNEEVTKLMMQVYLVISNEINETGSCFLSNSDLGDILKVGYTSVSTSISKLEKLEYISKKVLLHLGNQRELFLSRPLCENLNNPLCENLNNSLCENLNNSLCGKVNDSTSYGKVNNTLCENLNNPLCENLNNSLCGKVNKENVENTKVSRRELSKNTENLDASHAHVYTLLNNTNNLNINSKQIQNINSKHKNTNTKNQKHNDALVISEIEQDSIEKPSIENLSRNRGESKPKQSKQSKILNWKQQVMSHLEKYEFENSLNEALADFIDMVEESGKTKPTASYDAQFKLLKETKATALEKEEIVRGTIRKGWLCLDWQIKDFIEQKTAGSEKNNARFSQSQEMVDKVIIDPVERAKFLKEQDELYKDDERF